MSSGPNSGKPGANAGTIANASGENGPNRGTIAIRLASPACCVGTGRPSSHAARCTLESGAGADGAAAGVVGVALGASVGNNPATTSPLAGDDAEIGNADLGVVSPSDALGTRTAGPAGSEARPG